MISLSLLSLRAVDRMAGNSYRRECRFLGLVDILLRGTAHKASTAATLLNKHGTGLAARGKPKNRRFSSLFDANVAEISLVLMPEQHDRALQGQEESPPLPSPAIQK